MALMQINRKPSITDLQNQAYAAANTGARGGGLDPGIASRLRSGMSQSEAMKIMGGGGGGAGGGSGAGGEGGFYGGPYGETNLSKKKYKKYAESQRNKLNNQQKLLGGAQASMLPRIQAGPGNAFNTQQLGDMHSMGLQQLQSADQQRNIGIANASAARGAGGPDVGALTSAGNRDANRGALAQGDLAAQTKGLELGLGQYSAFNSAFGNVGSQQASARDAYSGFLQSERPEQVVNPFQMAQFQSDLARRSSGGGGGGGYGPQANSASQMALTGNGTSYGKLGTTASWAQDAANQQAANTAQTGAQAALTKAQADKIKASQGWG